MPIPPTPPPKTFTPPHDGEVIVATDRQYFLGPQLGSGAFGAVFECRDEWGNELVAKVLLPRNRTYEDVREEWMHELRNLERLRHPNITYIYDAFEYRDTFYLVIERCSMTLADLFSPDIDGDVWLPYVARDILHALDFIHSYGYVHKDLHPGNIFISEMRDRMVPGNESIWQFKIGDLGISRLEGEIRLFSTILAQWMLPPEFLAPDDFGVLGRHVDIYHTGLLLLSLLLHEEPEFTEQQIVEGLPRQIAESLPSPFSAAIARALRRHVADRTQSAMEMWREISFAAQAPK